MFVNSGSQAAKTVLGIILAMTITSQLWGCHSSSSSNTNADGPQLSVSIDRMVVGRTLDSMTTEFAVTVTGLSGFQGYWHHMEVYQYFIAGSFRRGFSSAEGGVTFEGRSDTRTMGRLMTFPNYHMSKEEIDAWEREGGKWILIPVVYIRENNPRGMQNRVIYSIVGEPRTFTAGKGTPRLVPTFGDIDD